MKRSAVGIAMLVAAYATLMANEVRAAETAKVPDVWPLQKRIDEIAASGGGTLTLTAGVYRTGAIFFKPGVNLHLEKGATILGVDEAAGYPMRMTRIEGETCLYYPALVNADRCDGFKISGEGVIDGHGANTWEEFWTKREEARKHGRDYRNKEPMRPRLLYVFHSRNVDVSGVTFKNSKYWTTHFHDCEDVVVHDCRIVAEILKDSKGKPLKGPSTDAVDISKCRRFTVRNVDVSVNDDGICIKGGKGPWADDYGKFPDNGPSTDVLVEGCTFHYPTHSALTLGSECPAASNVTMRNCVVDGCGDLLYLKMRTDTPQHYSNVLVEKCRGKCNNYFHAQAWSQYHDAKGRSKAELKSYADGVTLRNNNVKAKRRVMIKKDDSLFEITNLSIDSKAAVTKAPSVDKASANSPLWRKSEWIAAADAKVADEAVRKTNRAADGTSWFVRELVNEGKVKSARWTTTGLGVYEVYVNGKLVGDDALKPGFTHAQKTRRAFSYDVTPLLKTGAGEKNFFAAEVSAGWWRDRIANYAGKKSAFRAVLEVTYADGSVKAYGTNATDWKAGVGGPVTHAGIFDGEEYDARVAPPFFGNQAFATAEKSDEFKGEILPSRGGEVCRRVDKKLEPTAAYVWKGVDGANAKKGVFGRVHKLRDVTFDGKTPVALAKGETLVVDFGQNCAGVPAFMFRAKEGTVLTCLPGEMLNDRNGEKSRGNDGPGGSLYRVNLRIAGQGMCLRYTFGKEDGFASYMPRHTFFGYRYVSVTATDDVSLKAVLSVPVTSIKKEMELGSIDTGVADVNKLVSNVYWGQLSNYLSVPTDCPQRNERLGWTADAQVFTEAGSFNADTRAFFHKWTRDLRDCQRPNGAFPAVAPAGPYGGALMRFGWADAGVIVPYQIWKQFGDKAILSENWGAMEKYVSHVNATKYAFELTKGENGGSQYADWLSYEDLETCSGRARKDGKPKPEAKLYWDYLGACYWRWDAQMMETMAAALGKDSAKYAKMAEEAKAYLLKNFFAADGLLVEPMRGMQTPSLFALKLGLVDGDAKKATIEGLKRNFADHGDCLQTGFLGTSILMETLSENGMSDIAYTLLLQHKNPSWLYSVDQGATTIWERWNSYTKEKGFGPVGMNSFNHYAYGAVLAWMYKDMAGIAADPKAPGFKNIIMAPKPDRRVGYVKAEYRSAAGLVKSAWRYEGDEWIWEFTVPEGSTATVTLPGEAESKQYGPGDHMVRKRQ